jgi:hypothetical protein
VPSSAATFAGCTARQNEHCLIVGRREDQRVGDRPDIDAELIRSGHGRRRGMRQLPHSPGGAGRGQHGVNRYAVGVHPAHRTDAIGSRPPAVPELRGDADRYVCTPHSILLVPAHRPARASSPSRMRRVHGAHPTEP